MSQAHVRRDRPTQNRSKAAYEAPRLEVVELQPEERLLICDKMPAPACAVGVAS